MLSDFMAARSSSLFGCASAMVESSCLLKSSCLSALHLCQHSVAAVLRVDCPFFETQQWKWRGSGFFAGDSARSERRFGVVFMTPAHATLLLL